MCPFVDPRANQEKVSSWSSPRIPPIRLRPTARHLAHAISVVVGLAPSLASVADQGPWTVHVWERAFDYTSPWRQAVHAPLERASRPWRLCVCYPHLKDSYWLSVNYGMVETARHLGVGLQLFTAGGYPNLERQQDQFRTCAGSEADAIILGTVSYEGMTKTIIDAAPDVPVLAAVNDIAPEGIDAMVGVPWTELGRTAGVFLAQRHPVGTDPVNVAWFPGPEDGGWVQFVENGFKEALDASSADIVTTKWGDTGAEIQHLLVEEALEEQPKIDYIVGTAPTAEAAVGLLRARGRLDEIGLISDYFTHGVFRGIKRGRILAAPTDFPVLQGRLAVDMAVRILEEKLEYRHAGPPIELITQETVGATEIEHSLSPATFTPTFMVEPTVGDRADHQH